MTSKRDLHHRQRLHYYKISTTQCEALAFIALTFIEVHTCYEGDNHDAFSKLVYLMSTLEFAFTAVVVVHCLQSCL